MSGCKNMLTIRPYHDDKVIQVPCGHCTYCRIQHTRENALRCLMELDTQKGKGIFVTLTFDDEHKPKEIQKRDLQLFFKRLRKRLGEQKIKYFACGEYGDKLDRPHYHAIIFGIEYQGKPINLIKYVTQKIRHSHGGVYCEGCTHKDARGEKKWCSPICESWTYGMVDIGTVTYESAKYVAGYVYKKYFDAKEKQLIKNEELNKPFQLQSGGLGKTFFFMHESDIIERGIRMNGRQVSLPKYMIKKEREKQQKEIDEILDKYEQKAHDFWKIDPKFKVEKKWIKLYIKMYHREEWTNIENRLTAQKSYYNFRNLYLLGRYQKPLSEDDQKIIEYNTQWHRNNPKR